jgi:hypothetical protein
VFTNGGEEAKAAVEAAERKFHVLLRVDWNKDGGFAHAMSNMSPYVEELVVDRSLSGALPEELSLVQGTAAAQLTMILTGEDDQGRNLVSLFSPYQINSPFWAKDVIGAEVSLHIGVETVLGIVWYPQFRGEVRTITPDRAENTVEITALDRVEKLRGPIRFAPWAVSEQHASKGLFQAQLMESHWVIDHCLRMSNCSTSPYRPITTEEIGSGPQWSTPAFYLSGNGGVVPNIGWMDNPNRQEFPAQESGDDMYAPIGQVHASAPEPTKKPLVVKGLGGDDDSDTMLYWVLDRNQIHSLASHLLGFTLIQSGPNGSYWETMPDTEVMSCRLQDEVEISIWIGAGQVWSTWEREGSSPLLLSSPKVNIPSEGAVRIHATWDAFHSTGPKVYVGAGSNNSGTVDLGDPITWVYQVDELAGLVEIKRQVSMQDIHVTVTHWTAVGSGNAYLPKPAKYAASLDRGINRLSFLPDRDRNDAWEVIKEVAEAEAGAAFWDEQGRFRFWNFDTIQAKQNDIVKEVSLDDIQNLSVTSDLDSIRNTYSMAKKKARAVNWVNIYESQDVDEFYVPAVSRRRFTLYLNDVVSPEPRYLDKYRTIGSGSDPVWNDQVRHGYVVQFLIGGVWKEDASYTSGVDIISYYDRNGNIIIDIWNGYGVPARLASGDGTTNPRPALHLMGSKVVKYDEITSVTSDPGSVAAYGPRNLMLDGDWYQDASDSTSLPSKMLSKTVAPTPMSDSIRLPGDPRLQLCDVMRIRDTRGFGEYFDVQVSGIRRRFHVNEGLTDELSVEMLPPAGIWDDEFYGLWDDTFVWG